MPILGHYSPIWPAGAARLLRLDARAGNDGWAGDQSKPLKTIQKAVAKAMPGDAVFVVPGTYSGTVKLPARWSSSTSVGLDVHEALEAV